MQNARLGVAALIGLCACSSSSSSTGFSTRAASGGGDNSSVTAPSAPVTGGSGGGSGGDLGLAPSPPPVVPGTGGGLGGGSAGGSGGGGAALLGPPAPPGYGSDAGATAVTPGLLTSGVWDDGLNYPFFSAYLSAHTQLAGNPGFVSSDYDASHAEFAQRGARTVIDAALVIDTTGSMSDELSYLTAEFAAISGAIAARFPNASQRWALVTYRDTPDTDPGDAYIVQHYDFTSDLQTFATTVGAQSAANGGDFPESPELGLEELQKLSWRTDPSVAKVAFWVGDAPQHTYRAAAMKQAIADVHKAGVHVYPVSASGTDDLLELTMRTAAEITGGRYVFLTNDSGIGDPHKVPEIPCYYVTLLAKALVRVASMELSGTYTGPDVADVIRVSGNAAPDGTCSVGDDAGTVVQIF